MLMLRKSRQTDAATHRFIILATMFAKPSNTQVEKAKRMAIRNRLQVRIHERRVKKKFVNQLSYAQEICELNYKGFSEKAPQGRGSGRKIRVKMMKCAVNNCGASRE